MHRSEIREIDGASYRLKEAKERAAQRSASRRAKNRGLTPDIRALSSPLTAQARTVECHEVGAPETSREADRQQRSVTHTQQGRC